MQGMRDMQMGMMNENIGAMDMRVG